MGGVKLETLQAKRRYDFITIWSRRYYHMTSRNQGRSTNKSGAQGKDMMTKDEFLAWCKSKPQFIIFLVMWQEWYEDDFSLWSAPSVDRIDSKKGYTVDNIQWLTFSDNCIKNNRDPQTMKGDFDE